MLFLGEEFYLINGMGLAVLVMGVFWFNYTKYKKVAAGEIKPSKSANLEPWKEEDTPDVVSSITGSMFMSSVCLTWQTLRLVHWVCALGQRLLMLGDVSLMKYSFSACGPNVHFSSFSRTAIWHCFRVSFHMAQVRGTLL